MTDVPGLIGNSLVEFGQQGDYHTHSMTEAKEAAGFAPLETLPAEWYNNYIYKLDAHLNRVQVIARQIQTELTKVITEGGGTPSDTDLTQVFSAIQNLIDVGTPIATGARRGMVVSDAGIKHVSVSATGVMRVNALSDWASSDTIQTVLTDHTTTVQGLIDDLTAEWEQYQSDLEEWKTATTTGLTEWKKQAEDDFQEAIDAGVGNVYQYKYNFPSVSDVEGGSDNLLDSVTWDAALTADTHYGFSQINYLVDLSDLTDNTAKNYAHFIIRLPYGTLNVYVTSITLNTFSYTYTFDSNFAHYDFQGSPTIHVGLTSTANLIVTVSYSVQQLNLMLLQYSYLNPDTTKTGFAIYAQGSASVLTSFPASGSCDVSAYTTSVRYLLNIPNPYAVSGSSKLSECAVNIRQAQWVNVLSPTSTVTIGSRAWAPVNRPTIFFMYSYSAETVIICNLRNTESMEFDAYAGYPSTDFLMRISITHVPSLSIIQNICSNFSSFQSKGHFRMYVYDSTLFSDTLINIKYNVNFTGSYIQNISTEAGAATNCYCAYTAAPTAASQYNTLFYFSACNIIIVSPTGTDLGNATAATTAEYMRITANRSRLYLRGVARGIDYIALSNFFDTDIYINGAETTASTTLAQYGAVINYKGRFNDVNIYSPLAIVLTQGDSAASAQMPRGLGGTYPALFLANAQAWNSSKDQPFIIPRTVVPATGTGSTTAAYPAIPRVTILRNSTYDLVVQGVSTAQQAKIALSSVFMDGLWRIPSVPTTAPTTISYIPLPLSYPSTMSNSFAANIGWRANSSATTNDLSSIQVYAARTQVY